MSTEVLLAKIINPTRDYSPKALPSQIEEFMKTHIYKDFLNEIDIRLQDMRDFLEVCPHDKYLETRGGIAAMRMVAGVFTDLLNNADEDRKGERDEG